MIALTHEEQAALIAGSRWCSRELSHGGIPENVRANLENLKRAIDEFLPMCEPELKRQERVDAQDRQYWNEELAACKKLTGWLKP